MKTIIGKLNYRTANWSIYTERIFLVLIIKKKIMKKYAMLVLTSIFMFSTALMAQEQTPPQGKKGEGKEFKHGEMSAQKKAEFMAKQLELTDAEKAEVQALMEKQDAKRKQHQAEVQKMKEEQKAKFEAEQKAQKAELEKIIGKEKFQKLETMRSEKMHKMQKMKHKGNAVSYGCPCCEKHGHMKEGMMKKEIIIKEVK